jgi:uncharacterized membrane-anchored protein YitT (DUF2179 family)
VKVIGVYARIYAQCLVGALKGIGKNPWTLLLPMGLIALFFVLALFLGGLSIGGFGIGGLILGLILDALGSCYLYFVGEVVAHTKASLAEFRKSVGVYFWSIMNFVFVLWIASLLMDLLLGSAPKGAIIYRAFWVLVAIPLNAVPEVLYQKGTMGGLATINRAIQFIHESWIEWFIPNILVAALGYWLLGLSPVFGIGRVPIIGAVVSAVVAGAFVHVWMVFRGQLFLTLEGTSHRQRMYRFRTGT